MASTRPHENGVPVKRTLCQIPVLCRLEPGLIIVELRAGSGHHFGDKVPLRRALWIRRWPAGESIMLFSDFSFNDGSCSRFFLIENLKYGQLTYSISAKVDGLFSPPTPRRLLPPSFLFINALMRSIASDFIHPKLPKRFIA
jgi:hypothetical protein